MVGPGRQFASLRPCLDAQFMMSFDKGTTANSLATGSRTTSWPGLGTWLFCGQTVKVWPFSEVVWPQIYCLAFWSFSSIFENLFEFWLDWHVLPHSGIQTLNLSQCALSQAHFPSWQLKLPSWTFPTQRMDIANHALWPLFCNQSIEFLTCSLFPENHVWHERLDVYESSPGHCADETFTNPDPGHFQGWWFNQRFSRWLTRFCSSNSPG